MSGESGFVGAVQRVLTAQSDRFSQLVRLSGLRPDTDFRHADLSGADLRGEDLRSFDFSNASFRGALVAGALFNDTVSKRQLAEADKSSRAVLAMIGERLQEVENASQNLLGPDVVVPRQFISAARMVSVDQARRHREKGVHLGDNTDLARRRMAQPFRLYDRTIANSRAAIILFEPTDDLDFDTLTAVRGRFERAQKAPMILLVPDMMEADSTRQAILRARLRDLPEEAVLDLSRTTRGPTTSRQEALAEHARDRGFGFLAAIARSQPIILTPLASHDTSSGAPWLLDGARYGRRGLYSSVSADLERAEDEFGLGPASYTHRHLFIRRDLYDEVPAETLVRTLTPRFGTCALSVFDPPKNSGIEYYLAGGSPSSPLWRLVL